MAPGRLVIFTRSMGRNSESTARRATVLTVTTAEYFTGGAGYRDLKQRDTLRVPKSDNLNLPTVHTNPANEGTGCYPEYLSEA